MGQYDKYPVRNGYGHIEYLTAEEIANLKDRGEEVEVLDNQPSSKSPPWAKNPANQAYINQMFYEEQQRKAGQQRRKRGGRGGGNSRWTPAGSQPPDVGVVEGTDHVASFKTGGPSGDDTLIADGDYSDDPEGFNGTRDSRGHDHHGPWGSRRRGKYNGPGN